MGLKIKDAVLMNAEEAEAFDPEANGFRYGGTRGLEPAEAEWLFAIGAIDAETLARWKAKNIQ